MELNLTAVEELLKADYQAITSKYRQDDEIEVTTANHRRLGHILKQICRWFPHPINILDVGCGTGRYFHCLQNVERLVGLDISSDMLTAAANPVLKDKVSATRIELVCGNAHVKSFPPGSFHFIYSLGMFGHACPVTVEICNRFYEWLKPGGKLFFNVVDADGLPLCHRARRRLRSLVYPTLTRGLQRVLDKRHERSPFFCLTRTQLLALLASSRFNEFSVVSRECESPLWTGRHLEAFATKASL